MGCGVGLPIEGEGKHSLAKTTLPRVSGAGGRVICLWDSEENVKRLWQPLKAVLTIENNRSNIHSGLSIKSDTGQHSQFMQCLLPE